jgi:DNA ligase-associated metallophosphoesterase
MTKTVEINGQNFILHPRGALFWEEQQVLLISDVHLGKVMHFRKNGMALPGNSISKNFEQLDLAVAYFNPKALIFLGDLFHSERNVEWDLFENWVENKNFKIILVAGNHDIINPIYYQKLAIAVCSELIIENFLLTHHPEERIGFYNFSGHIHPGIKLYGVGRQTLKLPCFFKKEHQMILPAFGEFTGQYYLVPTATDCVYAITKEEVILIC